MTTKNHVCKRCHDPKTENEMFYHNALKKLTEVCKLCMHKKQVKTWAKQKKSKAAVSSSDRWATRRQKYGPTGTRPRKTNGTSLVKEMSVGEAARLASLKSRNKPVTALVVHRKPAVLVQQQNNEKLAEASKENGEVASLLGALLKYFTAKGRRIENIRLESAGAGAEAVILFSQEERVLCTS
jgi:hypothetical protein